MGGWGAARGAQMLWKGSGLVGAGCRAPRAQALLLLPPPPPPPPQTKPPPPPPAARPPRRNGVYMVTSSITTESFTYPRACEPNAVSTPNFLK